MGVLTHTKILFLATAAIWLQSCASTQGPAPIHSPSKNPQIQTRLPAGVITALPDRTAFHQQDPRWAAYTLGGSGEALKTDGCLVTAAAMALSNLGFTTNPGDLNERLKAQGGFNRNGWLVWSGLERVTGGRAKTKFYAQADTALVSQCLSDGYYPLVKFKLPSRKSHWALVVSEGKGGFYVRDPMVTSRAPIPLSARAGGIDAVRCLGVDKA